MIKVDYYEVALSQVMDYFVKGFRIKDGVKPADVPPEWIVDTSANRVVFKLFIETDDPLAASPDVGPPTV